MEKLIKSFAAYSDNIIETMKTPFLILDKKLKVLAANQVFYKAFRLKKEIVEGRFFYELERGLFYIPELRKKLEAVIYENKRFDNFEVKHNFPHGGLRLLNFSARQIIQVDKRESAVLISIEDMTDRVKYRERLEHARKIDNISIVSEGIAGEFKSTFREIKKITDDVLEKTDIEEPIRSKLENIISLVKKSEELIEHFLIGDKEGASEYKIFNLSELIKTLAPSLKEKLPDNIKLEYYLDETLPLIKGLGKDFSLIISNLVLNSFEAMEGKKGNISITTYSMNCDEKYLSLNYLDEKLSEGVYVHLRVMDNGAGISEENLSKIFVPFFSTKEGHKGLGLNSVLKLIRKYRGAINFLSNEKGTTFKLLFPADK